jgi:uncharacterized protein YbcV (DUF1398 family)
MNAETIAECMQLSFADTHFPKVVQKLADAGVRSYTADLIRLRKTYHGADSDCRDEAMPLSAAPDVAETFDTAAVAAAIKNIQQQKLGYAEFLRQIMAAGCSQYRVFIGGRKAIYFGRNGDMHVEPFPAAKP